MRAFTIVEMILSIAILGVMAMAIAPGLDTSIKSYAMMSEKRQNTADIGAAVSRMVREIRQIPGSAQITTLGANSFTFQFPAGTSITYSLSGTNLMRGSNILASNISALAFTYYDAAGSVTSTPANVKRVQLQVTSSTGLVIRTQVFLLNTSTFYSGFTQS